MLWRCSEGVRAIGLPSLEFFDSAREIMELGGPPPEDPFYSEVPDWAKNVADSMLYSGSGWAVVSKPVDVAPHVGVEDREFLKALSRKFAKKDGPESRLHRIEQWLERSAEDFERQLLSLRFDNQDAHYSMYHFLTAMMMQEVFREKWAALEAKPATTHESILDLTRPSESESDPAWVFDSDELVMVLGENFCRAMKRDLRPLFGTRVERLVHSCYGVPLKLKVIFEIGRSESYRARSLRSHVAGAEEILVIWQGCLVDVLRFEEKGENEFALSDRFFSVIGRNLPDWFHIGHLLDMLDTESRARIRRSLADAGWSDQRLFGALVQLLRMGLTLRAFDRILQVVCKYPPDVDDTELLTALRKSLLPLGLRRHANRFEIETMEIDTELEALLQRELQTRETIPGLAERIKRLSSSLPAKKPLLVHHMELLQPLAHAFPNHTIFTKEDVPDFYRIKVVEVVG